MESSADSGKMKPASLGIAKKIPIKAKVPAVEERQSLIPKSELHKKGNVENQLTIKKPSLQDTNSIPKKVSANMDIPFEKGQNERKYDASERIQSQHSTDKTQLVSETLTQLKQLDTAKVDPTSSPPAFVKKKSILKTVTENQVNLKQVSSSFVKIPEQSQTSLSKEILSPEKEAIKEEVIDSTTSPLDIHTRKVSGVDNSLQDGPTVTLPGIRPTESLGQNHVESVQEKIFPKDGTPVLSSSYCSSPPTAFPLVKATTPCLESMQQAAYSNMHPLGSSVYHVSAQIFGNQKEEQHTVPIAQIISLVQAVQLAPTMDGVNKPTPYSTYHAIPSALYSVGTNYAAYNESGVFHGGVSSPPAPIRDPKPNGAKPFSTFQVNTQPKHSDIKEYPPSRRYPQQVSYSQYEFPFNNPPQLNGGRNHHVGLDRVVREEIDDPSYGRRCTPSILKEPYGPHGLSRRDGYSKWRDLERQLNHTRSNHQPYIDPFKKVSWNVEYNSEKERRSSLKNYPSSRPHAIALRGGKGNRYVGGLASYKRTPYRSLAEMATYYSQLDFEDQSDVISLLLACRKLEKQIEEQQVLIDMLDNDLAEAQATLNIPPKWRNFSKTKIEDFRDTAPDSTEASKNPAFIEGSVTLEPKSFKSS